MSKFFTTILFLCCSVTVFSQEISGNWIGEINITGNKLGFSFNIIKIENGFETTMDIPLQGLKDVKAEQTSFEKSTLSFTYPQFQLRYEGNLNDDGEIIGMLTQAGQSIPLNLKRGVLSLNRPQEPKPPFDYFSEEIEFQTKDNLKLSGTLTLPRKNKEFPIVIIISGSGPQNRDGEMFGHKPYWVLADHLTKNGIGVLRFDERGVGESQGNFEEATIATFTSDIESAIKYLQDKKDINTNQLGLIGHSLGGIIAPKIASKNKDIAFIVLMAAPGVNGDQLMLSQKATYEKGLGLNEIQIAQGQELVKGAYDIIINYKSDAQQLRDTIYNFYVHKYQSLLSKEQREAIVEQLTSNEMIGLIRTEPSTYLQEVNCPTLAINGAKDFQVLPEENLNAIEIAIKKGGNEMVKTVVLENLNHLFQESNTGLLAEYSEIEQTMSPIALELITNWIKEQAQE